MSPPKSTEPEFTIHNAPPQPIKDGDDVDQIMHEVGKELKKEDHRPPKHHFFSRNNPAARHKPVPPPPNPDAGHAPPAATPAQPKPQAVPAGRPAKSSAPVLVITITIIVTGILIAAAVSASK